MKLDDIDDGMESAREFKAINDVRLELHRATKKYGVFRTTHEGGGVLKEEEEELWDAVKANDLKAIESEAVQVAAMAIRILIDVRRTLRCSGKTLK